MKKFKCLFGITAFCVGLAMVSPGMILAAETTTAETTSDEEEYSDEEEEMSWVQDDYDLLTYEEWDTLNQELSDIYEKYHYDAFTKIDFCYPDSVASIKVGQGVKSEGELIISGTKGYIYVPAPWWKTEYYEIRYENQENNRRYFYQLEGEGIRYELVSFARSIESGRCMSNVEETISCKIAKIMEQFMNDEIIKI